MDVLQDGEGEAGERGGKQNSIIFTAETLRRGEMPRVPELPKSPKLKLDLLKI
jgi:hypothetical protein